MGCKELRYNRLQAYSGKTASPLEVVYGSNSRKKVKSRDKYQWDLIHDPQNVFTFLQDETEGEILDLHMSKESIKNLLLKVRGDNIAGEENTDLSSYFESSGTKIDVELTNDFTLEYISVEVKSGKNKGDENNPLSCDPLIINPMEILTESVTAPEGLEGSFIKLYYNRLDKEVSPKTGYIQSNSLAVSFIVKESQKDEFEEYLHAIETIFLNSIIWVSQFNEDIFGLCTGCWRRSCCRRATEYMMGNTNIANCTDSTIAESAPYMPVFGKINLATFSDNSGTYTSATYNAATLNYDTESFVDAVKYIKDKLRSGLPILIGTHYTNGTSTPPRNNNRATRHFMVVVGMGMEGDNLYFRFYDPGRGVSSRSYATSINNKLTISRKQGFIQGNYQNRTYTITEVVKVN